MLRTLLLTLSSLLAMAKQRPWEPLLIMTAIVLANAGLVTVLLINEGATQGELLQSKQGLTLGSIITPADSRARFTQSDYATLRKQGFTQLVAIAERNVTLSCNGSEPTATTLTLLGVDTQPLLGSTFGARGFEAPAQNDSAVSLSYLSQNAGKSSEMENRQTSAGIVLRSNSGVDFAVNGLIHPLTNAKLTCHDTLNEADKKSAPSPYWPATVSAYVSSFAPQNTILISIDEFYRGGVTIRNDKPVLPVNLDNAKRAQENQAKQHKAYVPLSGFIALSPLSQQHLSQIETLLGIPVKQTTSNTDNDTGSLPDSFRLNLWAMSGLMGVVALFIVLNALNLMYRTRLPNIIRLRQLGISQRILSVALFTELLVYCVISIPIGMFIGFQAASWLSPVINSTFTSLFNAVFVNPDVNLLFTFGFALTTTLISLVVFSLVSIIKLSNALTVAPAKKENALGQFAVGLISLCALLLLFIAEKFVSSTASALFFVALLLLTSCALVLLWLPTLSKLLTRFVPKQWPVFHYVIANMHLLSSKTRLAVCAFFIALTANIGMNTMTDSFRDATEQWLTQRLYAPFYLYTDAPLRRIETLSTKSLPPLVLTPLLKAEGAVIGSHAQEETHEVSNRPPTYVSISSYPVHQNGKKALVLDDVINNDLNTVWREFTEGKGVFINQQLAFALNAKLGHTLDIENIRLRKTANSSSSAVNPSSEAYSSPQEKTTDPTQGSQSSSSNSNVFAATPQWKVLGIYPDYGNLNGQILVPLPSFNRNNPLIRDQLFSGVMAIYPEPSIEANVIGDNKQNAYRKNILEQQLKSQLGEHRDIALYTRQALLNTSMQTFDRTFILTDGLNITTLLVAGVAFAVSLTVLTIGSAAQLSVLRALGVSQLKVKASLFAQYLLLCFISALLAIPFGVYLAYVFIQQVNRHAFNWVYPLSLNAQVILSSVGLSLLIVSLVLLLPLGKLKPKIDLRQEVQL
ncbi:ABC transporter permease [Alteromonas portus]|uniref:ABC transporter permease n=1 Tax=Alteromonas portus TaxID=2565549 RepID=A0A4V6WLX5_9ALTE|nr:ABC transporter permease [Alteromonas portus]TKB03536.1 ABC transporter permease [Alteromonas portus]